MSSAETVYFEGRGVKVTDAMFIDSKGDQIPIRNISSVRVRCKKPENIANIAKWLGIVLMVLGGLALITSGDAGALTIAVLGIIFFSTWYFNKVYLEIGAGGTIQESLSAPARIAENWEAARRTAEAINTSITDMQKAQK